MLSPKTDQLITWTVDGATATELIIRLCNDFPTTEREVRLALQHSVLSTPASTCSTGRSTYTPRAVAPILHGLQVRAFEEHYEMPYVMHYAMHYVMHHVMHHAMHHVMPHVLHHAMPHV